MISETLRRYKGLEVTPAIKREIERQCVIYPFDGGCFIFRGQEMDCFVAPRRRRVWMKRELLRRVIGGEFAKHGRLTCGIHRDNAISLKTAEHLGFEVISRGEVIKMELKKWKL